MNKTRKVGDKSSIKTTRKIRSHVGGKSNPKKRSDGTLIFKDYPDFRPNLTPREMFQKGSFGGTYWRPIYSSVVNKNLKNIHKKYPKSWWKGIPEDHLTRSFDDYDTKINKYGVKVGTTLEFWEGKKWITKYHPYGWVQWYCDFYQGKRTPDDERQIGRWSALTGEKGRFKNFLINLIKKRHKKDVKKGLHDYSISPKIRQVLQHWAYEIRQHDLK
jgi:hypothetical protein